MAEFDRTESGMNRRDLLKKGAVGGALLWTAPVVLSATASAQTPATGRLSPPPGCTFELDASASATNNIISINVSPDFHGPCDECVAHIRSADIQGPPGQADPTITSVFTSPVGFFTVTIGPGDENGLLDAGDYTFTADIVMCCAGSVTNCVGIVFTFPFNGAVVPDGEGTIASGGCSQAYASCD